MHRVEADEQWQKRIVEAGIEFWKRVESGKWPIDVITQLAEDLAFAKARIIEADDAKKASEAALINAMAQREMKKIETASGIKASVVRRRVVDKPALEHDQQWIELKPYLDDLAEKKKALEAKYKTVQGAPYVRVTLP